MTVSSTVGWRDRKYQNPIGRLSFNKRIALFAMYLGKSDYALYPLDTLPSAHEIYTSVFLRSILLPVNQKKTTAEVLVTTIRGTKTEHTRDLLESGIIV